MCKVVNKYKESYDVYIGRGSIWGNPFPLNESAGETREVVVEKYRGYLFKQVKTGKITMDQLRELNGKTLGCFCKPKPCHGDIIVKAVVKQYGKGIHLWGSIG